MEQLKISKSRVLNKLVGEMRIEVGTNLNTCQEEMTQTQTEEVRTMSDRLEVCRFEFGSLSCS